MPRVLGLIVELPLRVLFRRGNAINDVFASVCLCVTSVAWRLMYCEVGRELNGYFVNNTSFERDSWCGFTSRLSASKRCLGSDVF